MQILPFRYCVLLLTLWVPFAAERTSWRLARVNEPGNPKETLGQFIENGVKLRRLVWDTYKANRQGRKSIKILYEI